MNISLISHPAFVSQEVEHFDTLERPETYHSHVFCGTWFFFIVYKVIIVEE